jgi:hypothetical protein
MTLKETLAKCKEFEFSEQITREMLWNEAYQLGRRRWYWGPMWWTDFECWLKSKVLRAWHKDRG